jgi:sodium transport system permease protein
LTQAALALTAGAAALVLMLQVNVWHGRFLPVPEEMAQFFEGLFAEASTGRGRILLIFALALSPAICEELLFRGAILSGLARRMHPAAAILLVSLLFGIMHLSIYRLLPTALLGILLTWLAWRTASILPGMLVHLMVNGSAVLLALNAMPLWAQQVIDVERLAAEGLSWPVLFTAAVVLTASLGALSKTRRADPARFG